MSRRSIEYGGYDLSPYTTAEVTVGPAPAAEPVTVEVPGRDGELLLGTRMGPREIGVRLFLDLEGDTTAEEARREIARALSGLFGKTLLLPGDGEEEYRDVALTGPGRWSDLFEAGSCELVFTAFDPAVYGAERNIYRSFGGGSSGSIGLGFECTFPVWPVITVDAYRTDDEVPYVEVSEVELDLAVRIEGDFDDGDEIVIDCAARTVTREGEPAFDLIAPGSRFFPLVRHPMYGVTVMIRNAYNYRIEYRERWL